MLTLDVRGPASPRPGADASTEAAEGLDGSFGRAHSVPKRPKCRSIRNAASPAGSPVAVRVSRTRRHSPPSASSACRTPWRFKSSHPHRGFGHQPLDPAPNVRGTGFRFGRS